MPTKPRLFTSAPVDGRLTPNRIKQKNAMIEQLEWLMKIWLIGFDINL